MADTPPELEYIFHTCDVPGTRWKTYDGIKGERCIIEPLKSLMKKC